MGFVVRPYHSQTSNEDVTDMRSRLLRWLGEQIADPQNLLPSPYAVAQPIAGIIPTALKSWGQRRELAKSVPEYAEIVENLGGITQNAKRLAQESWPSFKDRLARWEVSPAKSGLQSAQEYRPLLHELLGKHGVVIPYIPKSLEQPLTLKTFEPSVGGLQEKLLGYGLPGSAGMYIPMWGKSGGDVILSTIENQKTVVPHEFSHLLQDLLTGKYSKGTRPSEQGLRAQMSGLLPGDKYDEAAGALWERFSPSGKAKMQKIWPYGGRDDMMRNELVAELTNPEALATTLPVSEALLKAETLKKIAGDKWPELGRFWNEVPKYIPERAYDIPLWSRHLYESALAPAVMQGL